MSEQNTEPTVEPAAAAPTPMPSAPSESTATPWDDPKAAQAEIERLRRENAKDRTNAKQQAADAAKQELTQSLAKALGLVEDTTDPAELTKQLTTSQADAKQARVELAVFRSAAAAGGDPAALLDSTSFLASLAGIDTSDGSAVADAIAKAVEANPRLGVAPAAPKAPEPNPAQGASGGAAGQLTEVDLERMTPEQVVKARKEGRLNNLMGI